MVILYDLVLENYKEFRVDTEQEAQDIITNYFVIPSKEIVTKGFELVNYYLLTICEEMGNNLSEISKTGHKTFIDASKEMSEHMEKVVDQDKTYGA